MIFVFRFTKVGENLEAFIFDNDFKLSSVKYLRRNKFIKMIFLEQCGGRKKTILLECLFQAFEQVFVVLHSVLVAN